MALEWKGFFCLHSPRIAKIEVVRQGKVRRAKLYYLRGTQGKASKVKEKNNIKKVKKASPLKETQEIAPEPKKDLDTKKEDKTPPSDSSQQ